MSFVKWVGGKSEIMKDIRDMLPKKIETYVELFVGGGAVLIELLNEQENKEPEIKVDKFKI